MSSSISSSPQSAAMVTAQSSGNNNRANYYPPSTLADGDRRAYPLMTKNASALSPETHMHNGNCDCAHTLMRLSATRPPGEHDPTLEKPIKYSSANNFDPKDRTERDWKTLPYLLFDVNGGLPKTEDDAAKLWKWRLDRPPETSLMDDPAAPDGAKMLEQLKKIRKSLEHDICSDYTDAALYWATHYGLTMPRTSQSPSTHHDLVEAIGALTDKGLEQHPINEKAKMLTPTGSNFYLFYKIFYKHFSRSWLVQRIDAWAYRKAYRLLPGADNDRRQSYYERTRGGFAGVARSARSSKLRSYRRALLKKCDWTVATTIKNKLADHTYTRVLIPEESGQMIYVVEPGSRDEAETVGGKGLANSNKCVMLKDASVQDLLKEIQSRRSPGSDHLVGKVVENRNATDRGTTISDLTTPTVVTRQNTTTPRIQHGTHQNDNRLSQESGDGLLEVGDGGNGLRDDGGGLLQFISDDDLADANNLLKENIIKSPGHQASPLGLATSTLTQLAVEDAYVQVAPPINAPEDSRTRRANDAAVRMMLASQKSVVNTVSTTTDSVRRKSCDNFCTLAGTSRNTTSSAKSGAAMNSNASTDSAPSTRAEQPVPVPAKEPKEVVVGERVAKFFDDKLYFGVIKCFHEKTKEDETNLWSVEYEDGDSEDYDLVEIKELLDIYKHNKKTSPIAVSTKSTASRKNNNTYSSDGRNENRKGGSCNENGKRRPAASIRSGEPRTPPAKKRYKSPNRRGSPCTEAGDPHTQESMPCHHDDIAAYIEENNASYFTEAYIKKKGKVTCCANEKCRVQFSNEEGKGKYKVGSKNPVHHCVNAKRHDHTCRYALCRPCFIASVMNKDSDAKGRNDAGHRRNSRRRGCN